MAKRKSTFWSRLFGFKMEKAAKDKATTVKLRIESLEERRVFATGLTTVFQNLGGSIEVHDASSRDNNFTISRSGSNLVITDNTNVFGSNFQIYGVSGAMQYGTTKITIPLATLEATHKPLVITTADGSDVVKIDTRFDPIPLTGITLGMGNQADRIELINDANSNVWALTGPQSGSVSIGNLGTVNFYGVESVKAGAGNDLFRLNYTGTNPIGSLNGNGGNNSVEIVRDADFKLTDSSLSVKPVSPSQALQNYSLSNIGRATIAGGVSNNWIDANYFTGSTTLYGGDGNDTIWGGYGNDQVDGGNGDDFVEGGPGDDSLYGGAGRDILVGGAGADNLDIAASSSGDDILISGSTSYGYQKPFCDAAIKAWVSNESYSSRVYHLSVTGVGSNNQFKLNESTGLDDGSLDRLFGGAGKDWYFAGVSGNVADSYDIGGSEQLIDVSPHAPPAPSFSATSATSSQVNLSWGSVSGATGYKIQQWQAGRWIDIASIGNDVTAFEVDGLNGNTVYTFRVGAYNLVGTTFAASQLVTTPVIETPSLAVSSVSANQVDLYWNNVSGARGYMVEQLIDGNWIEIDNGLDSTDTGYAVYGLDSNTTFYFRLSAFDDACQAGSEPITVTTSPPDLVLPDAPIIVGVHTDTTSVTLEWEVVPDATSYVIEKFVYGTWQRYDEIPSNWTSYCVLPLNSGTLYDFRVGAQNSAGINWSYASATTDVWSGGVLIY